METILQNQCEKKPYFQDLPPQVKQVSLDSMVMPDVELGERSRIEKSAVGRGVKIGSGSKISNCVLMNYVEIGNE